MLDPRSVAFERCAVRWLARLLSEVPGVALVDAQLATAAISGLPLTVAVEAFPAVCDRAGLSAAADAARRRRTAR